MPKLPLAATAVASIFVTLATGSVAQTLPPNLPLAIICFNEKTQTWRIGYLDVVTQDGSATYVAGDLWATVNAKGLVQPPSNRSAGVDCFGKTLDELRAAGRVMEFKRSEQKSAQRDRQCVAPGSANSDFQGGAGPFFWRPPIASTAAGESAKAKATTSDNTYTGPGGSKRD